MTKEDILNKAIYIQFPYNNEEYKNYYDQYNLNINRLPIIKNSEVLYTKMDKNGHHYTTEYHKKYVLPLLDNLFNFDYNINDFNLIKTIIETGDLTYLRPKNDYNYNIKCFNYNSEINGKYEILINPEFFKIPSYRTLYRYPHACSRIINLDINNDRKIFISGDSQMIPTIPVLANYYKEVWYFDNRTGWKYNMTTEKNEMVYEKIKSFVKTYENINFNDVLIELYTNKFNWYTEINLM